MGVQDLWSIVGPVCESVPLYSLTGKTLAVDLSLWVCEAQHVQAMMGRVTKPHLRNLFFRVSSLTLMGVKLVFVMEGEAPKLKSETMSKRTQMRFGGFKRAAPKTTTTKSTNRGRFNAVLKECAEMLDYLGVPWVTAAGEAEAMCAYLDAQGLVDGCITNDGDAFLYGAKTVYRNFNMNTKDPQVDCYKSSRVQTELNLSREDLVGLAILLGCDYIPKGVSGVGKEQAMRLIQSLRGQTLLQRFSQWREEGLSEPGGAATKKVPHCTICRHPGSAKAHERGGCMLCASRHFCEPKDFDYQCPCDWHRFEQTRQASSVEAAVKKKTLASEKFPFTEIIHEFLVNKDKPVQHFKRRKPDILSMQNFAYSKMDWPKHYTCEKVLVLMTYAELMNRIYGKHTSSQIKPLRILKPRVRNSVACFEVIWSTPDNYVFPEERPLDQQEEVRTVEEEALFRLAFPEVVELYLRDKALNEENKTKKKKSKSKKEKPLDLCDGVSELLAQMTLQNSTAATQDSQTQAGSADGAEIVCLDTPVALRRHKDPRDDSPSPGDRPGVPVADVDSPQCRAAFGKALESEAASSPSVSSVVEALHLSDIDWDASSFTSSPPPPQSSATRTAAPTPAEAVDSRTTTSGGEGDARRGFQTAGSKPATESHYADCPLRDRVLMKNILAAARQMEAREDEVTKHPLFTSNPREFLSSRSQDLKQSEPAAIKGGVDTSLSEKPHVVDKKVRVVDEKQSVAVKADQGRPVSKLKSSQTLGDAEGRGNCKPNPTQKQTFAKTAVSLRPAQSQRSYSDPVQGNNDRKLHRTTKKSVCAGICSSSEDSDAENQRRGARRTRIKPKIKPKVSYLAGPLTSRVTTTATTTTTLKNACGAPSFRPKAMSNRVDNLINGISSSTKDSCSSSTKGCSRDVLKVNLEDNVFLLSPASPIIVSDSDDPLVCDDSPLPLAERLKLKSLK